MTSQVVEVAIAVPLDTTFHYRLPDGLEAPPGVRVLVPWGKRRTVGVVVASAEAAIPDEARKLRPVLEVLDAEPVLPDGLLPLVLESARDALCPPGIAVAAAIPPGTAARPGKQIALRESGRTALARGEPRGALAKAIGALARGPVLESAFRRRFPAEAATLDHLERIGWIERRAAIEPARVRIRTRRLYHLAPGQDVEALLASLARAPRRREIVDALARGPAALAASEPLRALLREGTVVVEDEEVSRSPAPAEPLEPPRDVPEPTAPQQRAIDEIARSIEEERSETFLLYGITGSGKTEVYLRAAAYALARGRGVIVLVPEISLTHQVVDRFRARFGDRVAVLHSGLSDGERFDQWRALREGGHAIAIGARSAVFAPLEDVGLIVIDEEHDSAYKSEEGFRYHARDVAILRARDARCPLVLGSATPDVETAYRSRTGEIRRLVLPERVASRPLPTVEIVDMNQEQRQRGRRLLLSRSLRRALNETLAREQQAILFLNRRGFATQVYCFACGHTQRCKHCDISLVYHATGAPARRDDPVEGELRCHYCGYREEPRTTCPSCGSADGSLLGFGTERLAEEVQSMFPHARVTRLDRDTSSRRGAQQRILAAFHRREIDVLVGTQMVAKGHDVPGVTLVGVVAADLGLHFPDFRSGERTFQLLTQVAGRAGRGDEPGRVVIQTFLPRHYAIALARTHDYPRFFREELARREPHGYPPFRSLVQVQLVGRDARAVERAATDLAARAAGLAGESQGLEVLGPAPAPVTRIRDEFRWQILLLGPREGLHAMARDLARLARESCPGVQLRLDANPLRML